MKTKIFMKWIGQTAAAMLLTATILLADTGAAAATSTTVTSVGAWGSNINIYANYLFMNSYLIEDFEGNLLRFEGGHGEGGGHLVEWYDDELEMVRRLDVPKELDRFRAFYKGTEHYFIVASSDNREEDPNKEVFRIIKYDENFSRLGAVSITGGECYTESPAMSGNLSLEQIGNELYIHTCRRRFTSDDGLKHQSNLLIVINSDTMKLSTKSQMELFPMVHVGHSFNQYVKQYKDKVLLFDHGDAYPRALRLTVLDEGERVSGGVNIMKIPGPIGENKTGIFVGGMEVSKTHALVVGNSVIQDENNLTRSARNIFVASVAPDKITFANETSQVKTIWLTNHQEGEEVWAARPVFIKVDDDHFVLLWGNLRPDKDGFMKVTSELNVAMVDGQGQLMSGPHSYEGDLGSDSLVVHNGKIMWYVMDVSTPKFYFLDYKNIGKEGSLQTIMPELEAEPARELEDGEIRLVVNGEQLILDVPPQLMNGRVMVPVRGLFEYLGARVSINKYNQIYVNKDAITVEVRVNETTAFVSKDGQRNYYRLETPSILVNDRTLIPLRFVAEALEAEVSWDETTNTVTVNLE